MISTFSRDPKFKGVKMLYVLLFSKRIVESELKLANAFRIATASSWPSCCGTTKVFDLKGRGGASERAVRPWIERLEASTTKSGLRMGRNMNEAKKLCLLSALVMNSLNFILSFRVDIPNRRRRLHLNGPGAVLLVSRSWASLKDRVLTNTRRAVTRMISW